MGEMNSFKYKEVAKRFQILGCKLLYKINGTHEKWHNPNLNRKFVIINKG